ncbi:hypothetical protein ACHAW5_006030 [Stephanodiscus triporus]|uniref:DUF1995 domain-containing protein n=1 Tax=Stephanodiscus triporus TaxID=2934178 RepID=A0ABD3PUF6_9STRA
MGNDKRAAVYSLKGGGVIPEATKAGGGGGGRGRDVLIFMTPSSRGDYRVARSLAGSGRPVVIVNGSFKVRACDVHDLKTIPGSATMAYYVKPLTYNSQVAGYLIRKYPSPWTVLDARSKAILGSFDDGEILVEGTNTPDLRGSGRLVQRSVDEWAIRARSGG